jgi:central glycolytic genes regulator
MWDESRIAGQKVSRLRMSMTQKHNLLEQLVPELAELFNQRYTILKHIREFQPIGRRNLSVSLNVPERMVRRETAFLKEAGFIDVKASGMVITVEGESLLEGLNDFVNQILGTYELESQMMEILNLKKVIVVPGDVDQEGLVLNEMGKAAAKYIRSIVKNDSVMAVTGGSSVGSVARALPKVGQLSDIVVIPARGGMGREVENQANTLSSIFAKKLGGQYRLLHVPDQLGAQAVETLLNEPDIRSIVDALKKTDILVYGIGRAEDMARRRNLSADRINNLERAGAVAEAFGYYFNEHGDIVYASSSIGLSIDELRHIPHSVGIAGGHQKAIAIAAVMRHWENSVLITDEGAAREVIKLGV